MHQSMCSQSSHGSSSGGYSSSCATGRRDTRMWQANRNTALFFVALLLSVHTNASAVFISTNSLDTRSMPLLGNKCNLISIRYGLHVLIPLILVGSACTAASQDGSQQKEAKISEPSSLLSAPSVVNKSTAVTFDSVVQDVSKANFTTLSFTSSLSKVNETKSAQLSDDSSRSSRHADASCSEGPISGDDSTSGSCTRNLEQPRVAASSYRGSNNQKGTQCLDINLFQSYTSVRPCVPIHQKLDRKNRCGNMKNKTSPS